MIEGAEPSGQHYAVRLLKTLSRNPDRVVLHWRGRGVRARDLHQSVVATAGELRRLGVGPGNVVAILSVPNSPLMLSTRYAAHLLGATVCYLRSINPGTTGAELPIDDQAAILRDVSPALLVTDLESADRADAVSRRVAGKLPIAVIDPDCEPNGSDGTGPWADVDHSPHALATIAFTSGSTGRPKGIRLSLRAWNNVVHNVAAPIPQHEDVRLLVVTPLSHTVGAMVDAVLTVSGSVVLLEGFDPKEVLAQIAEARVSRLFLSTPQLYALLDQPELPGTDLRSLRQVLYSGSRAASPRMVQAARVFGAAIVQGYGTTEGGRVTVLGPADHLDPDLHATVGRPFPEVSIRIRDPENGAALPAGRTGEIWMRSPHMMDGYWNDPEATRNVLRDGWYRTGDLGSVDRAGYVSLVDRVADVVKTGGSKIYPGVVEDVLMTCPGVAQAAVYGVRDTEEQEHLHAVLMPAPGATVSLDQARALVADVLTPAHVPDVVSVVPYIPLNDSGKPDKPRLRRSAGAHQQHPVARLALPVPSEAAERPGGIGAHG